MKKGFLRAKDLATQKAFLYFSYLSAILQNLNSIFYQYI